MVKEENFRKAQIDMAVVEFSEQMAIENPGMYRRMTQDGDNVIKPCAMT